MTFRLIVLVAVACLALAGCKTDPNTVLLERDLRRQEEVIYSLRNELEDADACLEKARQENADLRRQMGGEPPAGASGSSPRTLSGGLGSRLGGRGMSVPPEIVGPSGKAPPSQPIQIGPPRIELPESQGQSQMPDQMRSKPSPNGSVAPPFSPPTGSSPSGEVPAQPAPRGASSLRPAPLGAARMASSGGRAGQWAPGNGPSDSAVIQQIALNHGQTGRLRSTAGDEALALLVEPRDRQGRLVAAAAPLAIVVLDRRTQGEAARVARWDLSADDVAALGKTSRGEGIYLELPWPARPQAQAQLEVFVRYTTSDGRKLEARQGLDARLAGPSGPPSGWNALPPGTLPPPPDETTDNRTVAHGGAREAVSAEDAPALIRPTGKEAGWPPRPIHSSPSQGSTDASAEEVPAPPGEPSSARPRNRGRGATSRPSDSEPELTAERPTWSPYR